MESSRDLAERYRFEEESAGRKTLAIRLVGIFGWIVVVLGVVDFFVVWVKTNIGWAVLSLIPTFVLATLLFAISSIGKHVVDVKRHVRNIEQRLPR